MPEIQVPEVEALLQQATPPVAPLDLADVTRRVRRRRRRRRGLVAGAIVAALVVSGTTLALRHGEQAEDQRVVTTPDNTAEGGSIGSWSRAADPPFSTRLEAFTGTLDDGRIMVWGGVDAGVHTDGGIYDPRSDSWETIVDAPLPASLTRASAALAGDRLAVVAVTNASPSRVYVAIYDVGAGTWTSAPDTGVVGDVDGFAWDGATLALVRVTPLAAVDAAGRADLPQTLRWQFGGSMWTLGRPFPAGPLATASTASTSDLIAVWPGASAGGGAIYEVHSDAWATVPAPPFRPNSSARIGWQNGQLVVVDGAGLEVGTSPSDPPAVAMYDLGSGTWVSAPTTPFTGDYGLVTSSSGLLTFLARADGAAWFIDDGAWERAPGWDVHTLGEHLASTSNTDDDPGPDPFNVSVRMGTGTWVPATEAPFTNRSWATIGTSGDYLLVVAGDEGTGASAGPATSAWVLNMGA